MPPKNLAINKKRCELSSEMRNVIVKLREEGKSLAEIGNLLGKSRSTIQRVVENFRRTGTVVSKPRSGRPKILTSHDERCIIRQIQKDHKVSAVKLAASIEVSAHKKISVETVRNTLRRANYHGRAARKKPWITKINKKKRLEFAKEHINKSEDFWSKIIFSDESKYNVFGSDGRTTVWRQPNQEFALKNLLPTVKHGGKSVMVWGCMAASGVGNLKFIEGTMNKYDYMNILKENLQSSPTKLGLQSDYMFQQDNDPKHTSYLVREWLLYNVPHQLHTPPQSPDLNPIEHIWELLERRIRQHNITSTTALKDKLQEEWEKITSEETSQLVFSMERRLQAVVQSKGNPTKY